MRVLAIDPGAQRVGFAVGDDATGVAVPRGVEAWRGIDAEVDRVARLANELGIEVIVVGLPTDMDGADTPACRRSRALATALTAAGLRVVLQPEVLTTDEARRRARAVGRRPRAPVDDLAAQVILEEYLSITERSDD
jgi:putative Holliday junction resolvase